MIDERYNQGGMVADYIVNELNRPLMGYFARRDGKPSPSPMVGIYGPKVMIVNESAGSGGDALPYYFKQQKIGPLVGTRTWGALVGTLRHSRDHRWRRDHRAVARVLRHQRPLGDRERGHRARYRGRDHAGRRGRGTRSAARARRAGSDEAAGEDTGEARAAAGADRSHVATQAPAAGRQTS